MEPIVAKIVFLDDFEGVFEKEISRFNWAKFVYFHHSHLNELALNLFFAFQKIQSE